MFTYKIESSTGRKTSHEIGPIEKSDPRFKEIILERNFKACRLHPGYRVKFRRTPYKGTVKEIIKDYSRIKWENNRPMFIVVELDSGEKVVANYSQLKGSAA